LHRYIYDALQIYVENYSREREREGVKQKRRDAPKISGSESGHIL
jgi:hypothetical protein